MASQDYLDFEIEIGPGIGGREYPVAVIRSPGGEARERLTFPFDELALRNHLKDLQIALLRSGGIRRKALTREEQTVREFGEKLFAALINGEVRSRYDVSQQAAARQGKGLRVKLRIQPPELASLPWEFLYDPRASEYICLSIQTPLVRYVELPHEIQPLTVLPPLRILGVTASPRGLAPLDIDNEKLRVETALAGLIERKQVDVVWQDHATWRDLQRLMRSSQGPWHILHFIGHGGFDRVSDEGFIALESEIGELYRLPATQLGRLIADHTTLRLAILNSCEGAEGSDTDIFSSTASLLIRRGLPAVLAMQYEISDRAAIEFARGFYEAVADGLPVDAATAEARKSVSLGVNNTIEWGTPILFMRAPDGVLFKQITPAEARRLAAEQRAREKDEREIRERIRHEAAERAAREKAEREATIQAAREKALQEAAEKAFQEELERIEREKTIREKAELEAAERAAREAAEHEVAERAKRENQERESAEKVAREKAKRDADEKAKRESAERRAARKAELAKTFTKSFTTIKSIFLKSTPLFKASGIIVIIIVLFWVGSRVWSTIVPSAPPMSTIASSVPPTLMSTVTSDPNEFIDSFGVGMRFIASSDTTSGFYIDKYEVTNDEYSLCDVCDPPINKVVYADANFAKYPVVFVTWGMAKNFCEWRGTRLPTMAEWKLAAYGHIDNRVFPWGNEFGCDRANYGGCVRHTTPVGKYEKGVSPYDVYDMAGNVWEWVDESYQNLSSYHLVLGGSFNSELSELKAEKGYSNFDIYSGTVNDIGFRCARDATP